VSFQSTRTSSSPAKIFSYGMAALTDKGRKRSNNEDAVDVDMARGLAVLADGMGAHAAGEVASQWAVQQFMDEVPRLLRQVTDTASLSAALRALAQRVNDRILSHTHQHPDTQGMGSTVVVAAAMGGDMVIGHLGDSRAYLCREGLLQRLTSDHKWLDEQVAMGVLTPEQASNSKQTNALTRALGIEEEVDMVVHVVPVQDGDLFLLCSDGLTDMLTDAAIQRVLTHGSGYPASTAQRLIDLANQMGGKDNIGVVVMRALSN
jgi:PPM family protein phosphatase